MKFKLVGIGKNAAGKERFMLTITGIIVLVITGWILGMVFMPKIKVSNNNRFTGIWHAHTTAGKSILQVKENGYFYFDLIPTNGNAKQYKGMLVDKITDTISLVSFNNDTLLFHKLVAMDDKKITLKSLQDSSTIVFEK